MPQVVNMDARSTRGRARGDPDAAKVRAAQRRAFRTDEDQTVRAGLGVALKGTPSARQAVRPGRTLAMSAGSTRGCVERSGERRAVSGRGDGSLTVDGRAAWPAASSASAHRRGPLPAPPLPRTCRARPPAVARAGRRWTGPTARAAIIIHVCIDTIYCT
jgi:hypothetical protein